MCKNNWSLLKCFSPRTIFRKITCQVHFGRKNNRNEGTDKKRVMVEIVLQSICRCIMLGDISFVKTKQNQRSHPSILFKSHCSCVLFTVHVKNRNNSRLNLKTCCKNVCWKVNMAKIFILELINCIHSFSLTLLDLASEISGWSRGLDSTPYGLSDPNSLHSQWYVHI